MKKHFQSLFNAEKRRKTLTLFVFAVILVAASQIVGTMDNLPGLFLLFSGTILLFFSVLHIWERSGNYAFLALTCLGLILLTFAVIHWMDRAGNEEHISEAFVMLFIFLVCIPGVVVGLIGGIYFAVRGK